MNTREQIQAEELDAYLTALQSGRRPPRPAGVPTEESALLEALLGLTKVHQLDPNWATELERRLKVAARRRSPAGQPGWLRKFIFPITGKGVTNMNKLIAYAFGAVALAALLLAALFVLSPSGGPDDRSIAQVTMTPPAGDQGGTAEVPTATLPNPTSDSPSVVEVPLVTPIPGPHGAPLLPPLYAVMEGGVGGGGQGGGSVSTDTLYILNAVLPESPGQVPAYVQREPAPLTVSYVIQMAERLGFDARVYTPRPDTDDDELPIYIVVDEPRRLWFHDAWLTYVDRGLLDYECFPLGVPPLDQSIERATQWLESAGLLEAPFQAVATRDTILFYHVLGSGWMVSEPFAKVTFSPDGRIRFASHESFNLDEVGEYPIISAQEAWDILASGQPSGRVWRDRYDNAHPVPWGEWGDLARNTPKKWAREYSVGQSIHLFGTLETLYPIEKEGALHVTMEDALPITMQGMVLDGDLQALVESSELAGGPIHVWGEVAQGEGEYLVLQVEGWQVEEWPYMSIPYQWSGTIQRGERDLLLTDDGRAIPIADLPADLADGTGVFVAGGEVDGTLEWSSIQEELVDGGMPGPAPQPAQIRATVEQVDLIYLIPRADYVPAEFDWGYRAPQPVWRFSGHTDQGYGFLVYVQAVEDAYLSPEP